MMKNHERPICHRAEDLVAYLYNEASETDAQDFADHAEQWWMWPYLPPAFDSAEA